MSQNERLAIEIHSVALEKGGNVGAVPVVHAATEAVFPLPAGLAGALAAGPFAAAEGLETMLPDFVQIVLVDIALREIVPVDVGTGADAAVNQDGGDVDAGAAEETVVADLLLVGAQEVSATEGDLHRTAFPTL